MGSEFTPPGYVRKLFCLPCAAGEHDLKYHGELGCLRVTDAIPMDWPCKCEERNYARKTQRRII